MSSARTELTVFTLFLFDVSILALSVNSATANCRNKLFLVDNECFPNMLLLKITGSKCVTVWYTIHFLPPPENLVLPEPKQLLHLHTWPSERQTQALQGSLRSKPQWTIHMQRWK